MRIDQIEENTNTYKPKNEVTRHFEEIWNESNHPDAKAKKAIKKAREDRMDHSDQGL